MNSKKYTRIYDLILVIAFFVFILFGIYAFINIRSEEAKCVVNPLQYGVGVYQKIMNATMNCVCSPQNNKYVPFIVTNNSIKPFNTDDQTLNTYENISIPQLPISPQK